MKSWAWQAMLHWRVHTSNGTQNRNRRMRNRMYGGVRGRKMKVGRKLLRFPPTRFTIFKVAIYPRNTQRKIVEDYFHDFDTQAKASWKPNGFHSPGQRPEDIMQHTPTTSCKDKTKIRGIYNRNLDLTSQLKAQKSKSHRKLSMQ